MSPTGDHLIRHLPQLRRYALTLTGNPDDADDLVQECLTRLLSRQPDWDRVEKPRAYLFAALHNVFVGQMNGRRMVTVAEDPDRLAERLWSLPAQLDRLALADLDTALHGLPRTQREAIVLIALDGLKYREAARRLGVPVGTVMSRLSRGRETLRALLEGEPAGTNGNGRMPARRRGPPAAPERDAKLVTVISWSRQRPAKPPGFPPPNRPSTGRSAPQAE